MWDLNPRPQHLEIFLGCCSFFFYLKGRVVEREHNHSNLNYPTLKGSVILQAHHIFKLQQVGS
jgi:hypothetical protein